MEKHLATFVSAGKDSFIVCRNSQGTLVRGTLMHFSNQNAIFEVYNPFSILQLSEVLSEFKIVIGERTLYVGRGVVSSLVNTGIMLVCEVTLVDSWSDVDVLSVLEDKDFLRQEVERFVADWTTSNNILPEFKILTSDFQGFFADLSLWLKQVEMAMAKTGSKDVEDAALELVEKVVAPVKPIAWEFLQRLEVLAEKIPSELAALHKAYLRRDVHPLTLCSPFVHRTFTKPLGYAGDYAMINMILGDPRQGNNIFAKTVNALVLQADVAEAHRNRIQILTQMLEEEAERARLEKRKFKVLNVACGPAREVVNFIRRSKNASLCEMTLLDFSKEALMFARNDLLHVKEAMGSEIGLVFVEKSIDMLLRESISRGPMQGVFTERFDIVYCAGLFDYLADSVCRRLMSLFFEWLLPGGLLFVTNVHSKNPQKYLMEYLLEWHIIHRNEEQMKGLIEFGMEKTVFTDDTGVNAFLRLKKDPSMK